MFSYLSRNYWSRRSLGQRVLLSFIFFIAVVAVCYASAIITTLEYTERGLMTRVMHEEISRSETAIQAGWVPRLPKGYRLYGQLETASREPLLEPLPAYAINAPEGFSEFEESPVVFLMKETRGGNVYALELDQQAFENEERRIELFIILSVVGVVLVAAAVGGSMARAVLRPVEELSAAVRVQSQDDRYVPLPVAIPDDEVGELARLCDRAVRDLHEALEREKAFTGDVSHELRTPLTIIRTSAELLELSVQTDKERELVARILEASESMRSLLTLFLELARNEHGAKEAAPENGIAARIEPRTDNRGATLGHVAETLRGHWAPRAEAKGLAFVKVGFDRHDPKKDPDSEPRYPALYLQTVLGNLLRNAVVYTKSGLVMLVATPSGCLVVDTGPGIAKSDAPHIFEAYRRGSAGTKAADEGVVGVGLGLSIAARLARRCGWELSLRAPEELPDLSKEAAKHIAELEKTENVSVGAIFELRLVGTERRRLDEIEGTH